MRHEKYYYEDGYITKAKLIEEAIGSPIEKCRDSGRSGAVDLQTVMNSIRSWAVSSKR